MSISWVKVQRELSESNGGNGLALGLGTSEVR